MSNDLTAAEGMLADAEAVAEGGGTQGQVYSNASEAAFRATKGLLECRRAKDMAGRLRCMEIIVKAYKLSRDFVDAKLSLTDELKMIQRTGDKSAIAKATELVVEFHSAAGDAAEGTALVQSLLELQKELGDKDGEAKALLSKAEFKLQLGQAKAAMEPAEAALAIFKRMGDTQSEEAATRLINTAYCVKGQPEKAPGREKALQALEALSDAIGNRDQQAWNTAVAQLNSSGAYTAQDYEDRINKILAHTEERGAVVKFLGDQGYDAAGTGGGHGVHRSREALKPLRYINFRFGGLGYGPCFRYVQMATVAKVEGDPASMTVPCVLQVGEAADDWDRELCYQPGILDGMLQTAQSMHLVQPLP